MGSITTDFWDVLLWSFWFFIWIAALMVWFRCPLRHVRRQHAQRWKKAGWALLLIFVPWLGALIYLIARGRSMTERQLAAASQQRAEQEKYIQHVAGTSQAPADQIANAKKAARLRSHQPGRVRSAQGQGARLTPGNECGPCPLAEARPTFSWGE